MAKRLCEKDLKEAAVVYGVDWAEMYLPQSPLPRNKLRGFPLKGKKTPAAF